VVLDVLPLTFGPNVCTFYKVRYGQTLEKLKLEDTQQLELEPEQHEAILWYLVQLDLQDHMYASSLVFQSIFYILQLCGPQQLLSPCTQGTELFLSPTAQELCARLSGLY